jgi:nitrogenase-associated protein
MAKVRFWEKPGCKGNARQRAALAAAGHEVEALDLLAHPWTAVELSAFLAGHPVADWFNRSAPAVRSGQVVPEALDEARALALLLREPLLIRRPLLQVGDRRLLGFDAARVDAWIGLRGADGALLAAPDGCVHPPGEAHAPGSCHP